MTRISKLEGKGINMELVKELQQMAKDGKLDFSRGIEKGGVIEWHFEFNGFLVDRICKSSTYDHGIEDLHRPLTYVQYEFVHKASRVKGIGVNHYYKMNYKYIDIFYENYSKDELRGDLLYKEQLKLAEFFTIEFKDYKKAKHMAELFFELYKLLESNDYRYGYITL